MRIVRFSSPNPDAYHFQDQKISLSKLSQLKALPGVKYTEIKTFSKQNSNKTNPIESHIKWVPPKETAYSFLPQE